MRSPVASRLTDRPAIPDHPADLVVVHEGLQPRALGRHRAIIRGKSLSTYLDPKDREFRDGLRDEWVIRRIRPITDGALSVLMLFSGRGQRGDLSNYIKGIEDAGNGFLWGDDRQIWEMHGGFTDWGPEADRRIEVYAWKI